MKDKIDYSLYAITDRYWHNDISIYDMVKAAILGGAHIIQLREKHISDEEFITLAIEAKKACKEYNIPLIINDNINVMLNVDADGIHVGQSDLNAKKVRELIGPNKILGVSVSNLEEANIAINNGADYLGVGAIFPTNTKDDADLVSIEELRNICFNVNIPVVAIGGIHLDTISKLKNTGISGVAVISEIFSKNDFTMAAKNLKKEIDKIVLNYNNYDLFVFDYDGTLLDSMNEWAHMCSNFIKSNGLIPTKTLDKDVAYMNNMEAAKYLYDNYHIGNSLEECRSLIINYIETTYKNIKLKDYAKELLEILYQNNKEIILLSQTDKSLLNLSLENNKINKYFTKVYSTNELNATKSDGTAFIKIKELYPNKRILIIEDALYAIKEALKLNLDVMTVLDDSNKKNTQELLEISNYYGTLNWMVNI